MDGMNRISRIRQGITPDAIQQDVSGFPRHHLNPIDPPYQEIVPVLQASRTSTAPLSLDGPIPEFRDEPKKEESSRLTSTAMRPWRPAFVRLSICGALRFA